MDYLDPKKKRLKRSRLLIGYSLLGIAISIATVLVVYLANGYYVDRETGEVIQNGLIYVDSKPESAEVYLNGVKQRGATDARLVVPEGEYEIELRREGYRTWSRSLKLEGGHLRRLTYARLVPEVLESEKAVDLPSAPTMATQSIDKRWLVMAFTDSPLTLRAIDLQSATPELIDVALPLELLDTVNAGRWEAIEWADDNKTFLATYTTDGSVEHFLINRDRPAESVNINDVFPTFDFTDVSIRNRKNDLVFLFDEKSGAIFRGNVGTGALEPYLGDVTDYVAFGDDAVLYVTSVGAEKGFMQTILKKGSEEYFLREIKADDAYLLEMSKLGNALVMGVGSKAEGRVIVYNDPIAALNENDFSDIPVPTTVLRVNSPDELSISADSSVIMARGGTTVASHEFEADRSYNFKLDEVPDKSQEFVWLDGQHATISIGGKRYMMDFDGSNLYELVSATKELGGFFRNDLDILFTFAEQKGDEVSTYQINRTFMRTPADR